MSLYAVVLIECLCLSNTMQEFIYSQFDRILPRRKGHKVNGFKPLCGSG